MRRRTCTSVGEIDQPRQDVIDPDNGRECLNPKDKHILVHACQVINKGEMVIDEPIGTGPSILFVTRWMIGPLTADRELPIAGQQYRPLVQTKSCSVREITNTTTDVNTVSP